MTETDILRLLRLNHIIGDPRSDPPIEPIIPVSKSSWWEGVKFGCYPKAIKVGANTTVWRGSDIHDLEENL